MKTAYIMCRGNAESEGACVESFVSDQHVLTAVTEEASELLKKCPAL
jgi:hypothetical protein